MHTPHIKPKNKDLYSILVSQAKVRTALGIPVCILMLAATWCFEAPLNDVRLLQLAIMTTVYLMYNLGSFAAAKKGMIPPDHMVVATAILDPLMLSAWLVLTNEAAPLFIGFYIFTILGFGFRIGTQPMWIGQGASIVGFLAAMALSEFWRANMTLSASVLVLLVAVPIYATILIGKLVDARELAEFESQAKSQLLANVSHELRTPLNGIVATAQLLKSGKYHSETNAYSDTILQLSASLVREIDDLLDSAKYHAGSTKIIEAPFDLRSLAEHLQMTLAPSAEAKGVRLSTVVDPRITDGIRSDRDRLLRALMNIAGNAVKFTEDGEVSVRFELVEESRQTYKIRFSVKDTGIGIPLREQVRVFEPFYRASQAAQENYPGTGLGMSIASDIVTALGGQLVLESEHGKGSCFYFDLLFSRDANFDLSSTESIDTSLHAEAVCGKRILAVEDHPVNCMLLRKVLEIDHHIVTVAETGRAALELLKNEDFDLIILDYNLDDIDGFLLMQQYHSLTQRPAPVFFLTADATSATKEKLMQHGAADVLHKPLNLEALRRAVAGAASFTFC